MRLFKQLLTNNNCYKAASTLAVKGIMWHSTDANNPNLRRYVQPDDGTLGINPNHNDWNQAKPDGQSKCVHAFIGKDKNGAVATYQTLPWNMKGWHAGKSAGNDGYIGFEICEDALVDKNYFNAVYKEACELTAYLCKMFNLDPMKDGVIICHKEGYSRGVASNHADVLHWFNNHGKTMSDVRRDVKALMGNSDAALMGDKLYRVQCGAFSILDNAKQLVDKLKALGYYTYLVNVDGLYKVQCGAFASKSNADALMAKLHKDGYSAFITTDGGEPVGEQPSSAIKEGDSVRVNSGAKTYDGIGVNDRVYSNVYTVDQLKGDRAVLDVRGLCTAFNIKDLTRV